MPYEYYAVAERDWQLFSISLIGRNSRVIVPSDAVSTHPYRASKRPKCLAQYKQSHYGLNIMKRPTGLKADLDNRKALGHKLHLVEELILFQSNDLSKSSKHRASSFKGSTVAARRKRLEQNLREAIRHLGHLILSCSNSHFESYSSRNEITHLLYCACRHSTFDGLHHYCAASFTVHGALAICYGSSAPVSKRSEEIVPLKKGSLQTAKRPGKLCIPF